MSKFDTGKVPFLAIIQVNFEIAAVRSPSPRAGAAGLYQKAYAVLRAHEDLGESKKLRTQLVVSTHSSHVAHETSFSCLRYFPRLPAGMTAKVPVSTVVDLSEGVGSESENERFVTRYLRAQHADLFFADAAILVEGAAERMLAPNFIRAHYDELNQCYITPLEIGGCHAHRL